MLKKVLIFYGFILFFAIANIFSQNTFNLNAQLLIDKKAINDADVTVFSGSKIIAQTKTNKLGKFIVDFPFQGILVIQFKKEGMPVYKVLISTKGKDLDVEMTKTKVVVFTLQSNVASFEGPDPKNVSASYYINKNGLIVEESKESSDKVISAKNEQIKIENKIENLNKDINSGINQLPKNEVNGVKLKLDLVNAQIDSLLFLSRKQSALILQNANSKAEEIISNAYFKPNIDIQDGNLKNEIRNLPIDEKKFYQRKDIIIYNQTISKLTNDAVLHKKDSIVFLVTMVQLKEEVIKAARLQLEIDKLNARTKADSIEIQRKEFKILQIEEQIKFTKYEISLKNLEIQNKNEFISFMVISASLLLILAFILYSSYKRKKKNVEILSKINLLINEQNEEIKTQNNELQQRNEEIETQKEEIIQQRDIVVSQKVEIIDSINYAKFIQNAILPSEAYLNDILKEHFVFYKPRDIVSGDFYWVKTIKNFTIIAVADCTGHGVPGAFMSMLGISFLNELVSTRSLDNTSELLNRLRNKVKNSLHQGDKDNATKDGMDLSFYMINNETLELQYSGAYISLYIVRMQNDALDSTHEIKQLIELKADRQPIAIHLDEKEFTNHKIQLKKNDCLYSFSDGFADQFGGVNGQKYKSKQLKDLITEIHNKPMDEQKTIIEKTFYDWKGLFEQVDDVLIMGVKI